MSEEQQFNPGLNPTDEVNVEAVRAKRKSMTRGPVAVTLLFLAGVAGLIGIGGFWSYPVFEQTKQLQSKTNDRITEIRKQNITLVEVQKRNRAAEQQPSDEQKAFKARIPPTFDVPQIIRDLVSLMKLDDPSKPNEGLTMKSFALEAPKTAGNYSTVGVTISYSGAAKTLQEFLETASIAREGDTPRRIATPTSVSITYRGETAGGGGATSNSAARFEYLLRQASRHIITDDEQLEFEAAKQTRVVALQEAIETRSNLEYKLRALESKHYQGGAELLIHNDELSRTRKDLKLQNDLVESLKKEADVAINEATGSLKIELYAESASDAKTSEGTVPPAPAT